jgi:hypothetical protein
LGLRAVNAGLPAFVVKYHSQGVQSIDAQVEYGGVSTNEETKQ